MGLQTLIAADAAALLAADDFAEPVTVTFVDGSTRTVRAWVSRRTPDVFNGVPSAAVEVRMAASATAGLLPAELDRGGLTVSVAPTPGGTPVARQALRPQDGRPDTCEGMVRLVLR